MKQTQTFYQYVLNTLSAANFNNLPAQLDLSARMTTMRLREPSKMTKEMIEKLAPLLGRSTKELIEEYQLGYGVLTVTEYKTLTA